MFDENVRRIEEDAGEGIFKKIHTKDFLEQKISKNSQF